MLENLSRLLSNFRRVYLTACCWFALGVIALGACQSPAPAPTRSQTLTPASTQSLLPTRQPDQTSQPSATPLPPSPTPASTLPVQAEELKGLPVEFWFAAGEADRPPLLDLIDGFNQENQWGIQVIGVPLDGFGVMEDRFRQALQQGGLPGLLAGYSEQVLYWGAGGPGVVDLSSYVADPAWGMSPEAVADFYPAIWERETQARIAPGTGAGLRVGLPWVRSGLVLLYNLTWAEQLDFSSLPSTPDEFRQQACAGAQANLQDEDRENDGTGGYLISVDTSSLLSWIFAFSGGVTSQDGEGYRFDTPESAAALGLLKGLYAGGCAWISESPLPYGEFAARRALFTAVTLAELPSVQAALADVGNQDAWTVLPFLSPDGPAVIDIYGPSLILLKSSPAEQLAAWLFARWLVSPEIQADWIVKSGYFPTRLSALTLAQKEPALLPQQVAALKLMSLARVEPAYPSWSIVRWSIGDVMAQLLSPDFQSAQIGSLLDDLDLLATEIFTQYR